MAADPLGLIGVTLDEKFRVDAFVEEGELRVTYRGHSLSGDAPVAVRCLNLPITLDDGLASRFVEGFHARTRLHRSLGPGHSSFVQVLSAGTAPIGDTNRAVHYEVREWLDDTTFAAHCAQARVEGKNGFSLDEVLTLLDPVADGLRYLHDLGVTHGELSPKNLLVVEVAGKTTLRIDGFGGGHTAKDKESVAPLLRVIEPEYTAPELVDKQVGAVGPWTDVFSVAVMVLECLAGTLGTKSVAAAVIVDPKHRPSAKSLGLSLPPGVDEVLERALSSDPKRRPADVGTFWRALKAAATAGADKVAATAGADKPASTAHAVVEATPAKLPPPPPPVRPPSRQMAPGAAPAKHNPLVKATLLGVQPTKLASLQGRPDEALELLPKASKEFSADEARTTEFSEHEAPTRRRDAAPDAHDAPDAPDALDAKAAETPPDRAELPLEQLGAAPLVEEPDVFKAALTGPTLLMHLHGAAVWVGEAATLSWSVSNTWVRRRAWPWIVARARDGRPKARVAFGASVFGGLVLLSLCVRLCAGGGSPKPAAVALPSPEPTSTATAAAAQAPEIPPPPPPSAAPESSAAIELPSAASSAAQTSVAFTRAGANAALEAAGGDLAECQALGSLRGPGSIRVAFNKGGGVAKITIGPPYAETPEGACILNLFGRAQMGPIRGAPGAVNYVFNMPK